MTVTVTKMQSLTGPQSPQQMHQAVVAKGAQQNNTNKQIGGGGTAVSAFQGNGPQINTNQSTVAKNSMTNNTQAQSYAQYDNQVQKPSSGGSNKRRNKSKKSKRKSRKSKRKTRKTKRKMRKN